MNRPEEMEEPDSALRRIFPFAILTSAGLAFGLWSSFRMRWVCDDAFITFRYIQNLLDGNGLVYNVGERVEGYTHFLWLWLVALFRWMGFEPIAITQVLGLLAYGGTLALFAAMSYRFSPKSSLKVPLTTLVLALHFDFKVWTTGGLETSLFTFLVSAAFFVVCVSNLRAHLRLPLTGLLLALGILTRPDGVVFYVLVLLFVAARSVSDGDAPGVVLRRLVLFNAPALLLFAPYLVWKAIYYGSILPNTYYAKSGGGTYFSQGLFYIWIYLKAYLSSGLLLLGPIALLVAIRGRAAGRERGVMQTFFAGKPEAAILLAFAFVLGYSLLFVARVGGDFMYARFLHPVIPFVYFSAEMGLQRLTDRRGVIRLVIAVALLLSVVHEKSRRDDLYFEEDGRIKNTFGSRGVADEHWYWSNETNGLTLIEKLEAIGTILAEYFEGEEVRVLLGGQASLGYYGRFAVCIEHAGLTDPYIARLPIDKRGRPGHEKGAPMEYVEKRGIHFNFMKPPLKPGAYRLAYFRVDGGFIQGEMLTYDAKLMKRLSRKYPDSIEYVDFESYLDEWIQAMPVLTVDEIAAGYQEFQSFYFLHNDDPGREQVIVSHLQERLAHPQAP